MGWIFVVALTVSLLCVCFAVVTCVRMVKNRH